jgi:hypothetical protein
MGLLSKAAHRDAAALDEMGLALRDRLLRLAQKKTSPYTALSLLKAYSPFQIGICISRNKNAYTSYAAVGVGLGKLTVSEKMINPKTKGFYRLGAAGQLKLPNLTDDAAVWLFPLDDKSPCGSALLIIGPSSKFIPESIETILRETRHIFALVAEKTAAPVQEDLSELEPTDSAVPPREDTLADQVKPSGTAKPAEVIQPEAAPDPDKDHPGAAQPEAGEEEITPRSREIRNSITNYVRDTKKFHGIVLDLPKDAADEQSREVFYSQVEEMIPPLGKTVKLPKHSLVLFPDSLDRELIGHRLANSLHTSVQIDFAANKADDALKLIHPYL